MAICLAFTGITYAGGLGEWRPSSTSPSEYRIAGRSNWKTVGLSDIISSPSVSIDRNFSTSGWAQTEQIDLGSYLEFRIKSLVSSHAIDILGFEFDVRYRYDMTKPFNWQIRSSLDGFSAPIDSATHDFASTGRSSFNERLDLQTLELFDDATFRLYGYTVEPLQGPVDFGFTYAPGLPVAVPEPEPAYLLLASLILFSFIGLRYRAQQGAAANP